MLRKAKVFDCETADVCNSYTRGEKVLMRSSNFVMLLLLSMLVTISAQAENILVNPGFETGDFSGWTLGGNSIASGVGVDGTPIPGTDPPFTPAFIKVRSGTFAGYSLVRCSGSPNCSPRELITLTQVVPVVANTTYSVGFFLGNHSESTFGSDTGNNDTQIFVDGVGLLQVGQRNIGGFNGAADVIEPFSSSFFSVDRTNVTVTFQIIGSGTARAGASFDDFYVTAAPVPEPATMLLLSTGLAGLGAVVGRRRKVMRSEKV
jgi:hypothetical protein